VAWKFHEVIFAILRVLLLYEDGGQYKGLKTLIWDANRGVGTIFFYIPSLNLSRNEDSIFLQKNHTQFWFGVRPEIL
jgi:hypothetical protein